MPHLWLILREFEMILSSGLRDRQRGEEKRRDGATVKLLMDQSGLKNCFIKHDTKFFTLCGNVEGIQADQPRKLKYYCTHSALWESRT